jgi:serine/threonine protein kinase
MADFWALGVTAFETLTGENPFDDVSNSDVLENIKTRNIKDRLDEIKKLAEDEKLAIDLTCFAEDFIVNCLEKKPENRLGF